MTAHDSLPETGNVHVWRLDGTGLSPEIAQSLSETLLPDERHAVAKFRDARQRDYRTIGRAMLRLVLSSYLDVPVTALVFGVGQHGKPFVRAPEAHGLRFNVSHADAMTLIGIANGQEIGVDVERIRRNLPIDRIAPSSFTGEEWNAFASVPESERFAAFFRCWTRKEAVLKAEGIGLHRAPNSVEVGLGAPCEITRTGSYTVLSLDVAPGYAAAIAVEGAGIAATLNTWNPAAALALTADLPDL